MSRRRYLVAYDIREAKRLRAVHARMKGFGWPLQYSVFVCDLDRSEKILLRQSMDELIHHKEDSIVIIDLGDPRHRGVDCFEFIGVPGSLPRFGPQIV